MAEKRITQLFEQQEQLFTKRLQLMWIWQTTADNFYPERADFTLQRSLGRDFAALLTTSYPLLCRRDLGNAFSTMLRPTAQDWFHISTVREDQQDNAAKRYLQWAEGLQRRAMYDRASQFTRATKEGDHDFAAFGQCIISVEIDRKNNTLLYRCWHLRDVAWCEDETGKISEIYRKWKPTARVLSKIFGNNVSSKVKDHLEKAPYTEIDVRHAIVPSDTYDKKFNTPWVSVFWEVDGGHILQEVGLWHQYYVIPRWQTVSGSQYAYSPATVAALPDARLIQAMTLVMLEVGQKAVDPPMLATQEVVRSDIQLGAGGITWIDKAYDERLGDALRPLTTDKSGFNFGTELRDDVKEMIKEAFYLNKLTMPQDGPAMTAYEVGQHVQEYIRNAMPLFEPMEMDYNGALCDMTLRVLMRAGAFGAVTDMPQSLRGNAKSFDDLLNKFKFTFESPLHASIDAQKGQTFQTAAQMLATAAGIDPTAPHMMDVQTALRDALDGVGVPAKWVQSEKHMAAITNEAAQSARIQQTLGLMKQGGDAAQSIGQAGQTMNGLQQGLQQGQAAG